MAFASDKQRRWWWAHFSFKFRKKREKRKRKKLGKEKIGINTEMAEYSPSDPKYCKGTCIGGLTRRTMQRIIALQRGTGGNIRITGGSETHDQRGRKVHTDAHHKGYKVDITRNPAGNEIFFDYHCGSDADWEDKYGFSKEKVTRYELEDNPIHYDIEFDQE